MFVTFMEVRKNLKEKVIRVVTVRVEHTNASIITEAFHESPVLADIDQFCKRKYGKNIPFLEIERIEDQFLRTLIDDVMTTVSKGG